MKAGCLTTEFWLSLVAVLLPKVFLLLLYYRVVGSQAEIDLWLALLLPALDVLKDALVAGNYTSRRTQLKQFRGGGSG